MTTTKVLRKRGATVTVAAYGEVLFAEGQQVDRWVKRFSQTVTRFTKDAAPGHDYAKRPLRPHNRGKRLKESITSTTQANPLRMRVDAAVASTAPYALFVDQGTGIYGGGGPYEAKVLPPWREGEGSLYEATWTPGKKQVAPVMIKGQKGQEFMAEGLNRGFQFMMRSAAQTKVDPRVGRAMAFFPEQIAGRGAGNTPNDAAFRANMDEWRRWRDEAFWRGEQLGRGQRRGLLRPDVLAARKNLAASRAAAEARRIKEAKRLANEEERKAKGQEKRDQQERKERLADARAEAVKFVRTLARQGIKASGTYTTNPETGRVSFSVTYRANYKTVTRYFDA